MAILFMLVSAVACATEHRLNVSVKTVKQKFTVLVKNNSIGDRLIEAFGTNDKAFIAEKLGFSSVQAVYKVINGERELDFERLQIFRDYTKRSIDWLLTGEGEYPEGSTHEPTMEESLERRMREIARQEIFNLKSEISEPEEENVEIKPAEMILAPVMAHIGGEDPKDKIREMLVSDEGIEEIKKRLKPRKRKTG